MSMTTIAVDVVVDDVDIADDDIPSVVDGIMSATCRDTGSTSKCLIDFVSGGFMKVSGDIFKLLSCADALEDAGFNDFRRSHVEENERQTLVEIEDGYAQTFGHLCFSLISQEHR